MSCPFSLPNALELVPFSPQPPPWFSSSKGLIRTLPSAYYLSPTSHLSLLNLVSKCYQNFLHKTQFCSHPFNYQNSPVALFCPEDTIKLFNVAFTFSRPTPSNLSSSIFQTSSCSSHKTYSAATTTVFFIIPGHTESFHLMQRLLLKHPFIFPVVRAAP